MAAASRPTLLAAVWLSLLLLLAPACCTTSCMAESPGAGAPAVHRDATFAVKEQLGVPYAQGVLCDAKDCTPCNGGLKANGPPGCDESCQKPEPAATPLPAAPGCPHPVLVNLTLDLYTPVGTEALGLRPAFVAIHSGGYATNGERGTCALAVAHRGSTNRRIPPQHAAQCAIPGQLPKPASLVLRVGCPLREEGCLLAGAMSAICRWCGRLVGARCVAEPMRRCTAPMMSTLLPVPAHRHCPLLVLPARAPCSCLRAAGFAPSYEMTAACKHFAARGFVAITMVYRLHNSQTGGGLAPANWTGNTPLNKSWRGGFLPSPQSIWPAVRDSKAAIRWYVHTQCWCGTRAWVHVHV